MSTSGQDIRKAEDALRNAVGIMRAAVLRLPLDHPLRALAHGCVRDLGEALSAAPKPGEGWRKQSAAHTRS